MKIPPISCLLCLPVLKSIKKKQRVLTWNMLGMQKRKPTGRKEIGKKGRELERSEAGEQKQSHQGELQLCRLTKQVITKVLYKKLAYT